MKELLRQLDPEVLLLVGVVIGQMLRSRSLREHGQRLGRLAGQVKEIRGALGIKGSGPDGGE